MSRSKKIARLLIASGSVGSVVRHLRKLRDETLQEVSQRAGISPIHLSRIERLKSSPTEEVIRKLAAAFDVPVSVLFGERQSEFLEKHQPCLTEIRSEFRRLGLGLISFLKDQLDLRET